MIERFFGGPPASVLIRLIVISVVVGVILTAIGISPFEIVDSVRRLGLRIYNMGFEGIEWLFRYFWLGAILVFPIWLISRIWNVYGREDEAFRRRAERDRAAGTPPPSAGPGR